MSTAVIKIPEGIDGMDCQSNGVHPIVLVNALDMLTKHYATQMAEMARKAVGNNPRAQEQWLDRLTKQYLGDNPGDREIDPNLFN
jgi:hypothetical protein